MLRGSAASFHVHHSEVNLPTATSVQSISRYIQYQNCLEYINTFMNHTLSVTRSLSRLWPIRMVLSVKRLSRTAWTSRRVVSTPTKSFYVSPLNLQAQLDTVRVVPYTLYLSTPSKSFCKSTEPTVTTNQ